MYSEDYENIYGDVAVIESTACFYEDDNIIVTVKFDNDAYKDFTASYGRAWARLWKMGFRE